MRALLICVLTLASCAAAVAADQPAPQSAEFFETRIRPLLANRCLECHSISASKGGLNLESRTAALKGGESGPAVVPEKPDESLLIEAVAQTGDLKMPPKDKLSDQEIGDLTAWVKAGAAWPQVAVSIPLGNLFDDGQSTSLGDAIQSDAFKAEAEPSDLAIDRIRQGWGTQTEIAPGVKFDFANVGADARGYGQITNDAWHELGGIQTLGKRIPETAEKLEQGIGMHANALIAFDLAKLREAGGIDAGQAFRFISERAGLNDCVFGSPEASAHVIVLIVGGQGPAVQGWVNGQSVTVAALDGMFRFVGEIPAPLKADGKYAAFDVPVPGDATHLVLVTTGAGGGENTISSDHTVFSGARLVFDTESARVARLGKTDGQATYTITAEQRAFWSFQPIRNPPPPPVKDAAWPKTDIDRFILAELERQRLQPVGEADRRTLIRRATFDLLGLPPAPEEVEAFVNDADPEAYRKLIDRLLSSPHYGERSGRLWLDVARYAEDQAHTFQARMYPQGFEYRDWVVQAFNRDLPYDQFVIRQIAGDLLPPDPGSEYDRFKAVGFFALGPVYYADAGCAPKAAADELDDRVDTLGRGFLGLTIACARCHDHKFDPIPQTDYYALAGIFSSTAYREAPLVPDEVVAQYNAGQDAIKKQEQKVQEFLAAAAKRKTQALATDVDKYVEAVWKHEAGRLQKQDLPLAESAKTAMLPEFLLERWVKYLAPDMKGKLPPLDEWHKLREEFAAKPAEEWLAEATLQRVQSVAQGFKTTVVAVRDERQNLFAEYDQQIAAASDAEKGKIPLPKLEPPKANLYDAVIGDKGLLSVPTDKIESLILEDDKAGLAAARAEVEQAKKAAPAKYAIAHSLTEGAAADMPIYVRGNPAKTGAIVPRGFLSVLNPPDKPRRFTQGSGRLELAQAVASPDNPLTARVMVNRIWQHHFGRGLVGTPSNFGALGERPSHPELLDHLASRFIALGWSIKGLHREIMLSAVYRLSSDVGNALRGVPDPARELETDPDNRWYWRMNRRRLDVESWRDALLAVSGNLDLTLGGPSGNLADANYRRRTMYGSVSRHNLDPLLRLFDFPDPNITSERRTSTTVPLQQLFVLNSDFMVGQARSLAKRLSADAQLSDAERIKRAILLLYGRPATDDEVALGLEFLAAPAPPPEAGAVQLSAWEQYAQVLLSGNEFVFVD